MPEPRPAKGAQVNGTLGSPAGRAKPVLLIKERDLASMTAGQSTAGDGASAARSVRA